MTKKEMVLEHLRTVGSITSLEAFERYKATRLAAIVHDVNERAGRKVIASEDVHGQSYVRYVLVGDRKSVV